MKKTAPILFIVVLLILIAVVTLRSGGGAGTLAEHAPAGGQPVPAFTGRTLAGKTVNFPEDYRGKLVLLDFWATWCPPCRAEIPNLVKLHAEFQPRGVEFLGISLDQPYNVAAAEVRAFAEQARMTWPQVYEDAAVIANPYGVVSIPAAFLIDGDTGRLLARGDDVHGSALRKTLQKFLAAKP